MILVERQELEALLNEMTSQINSLGSTNPIQDQPSPTAAPAAVPVPREGDNVALF